MCQCPGPTQAGGRELTDPTSTKIKVMTMKVSKGLEFPVGATRATQRFLMGVNGDRGFRKAGKPQITPCTSPNPHPAKLLSK